MEFHLNDRAAALVDAIDCESAELGIAVHHHHHSGRVLDFGVEATGGLDAGIWLATACMVDLGEVSLQRGNLAGIEWPHVVVNTDHPKTACLLTQYAGWRIQVGDFFAMGSGPMRAAVYDGEELFDKLDAKETTDEKVVGMLEASTLPDDAVMEYIAERTGVDPEDVDLLVAPTSSMAGNLQVVARSVETAMHKLFELGFNVDRVVSGFGSAPLPPVAADDLTGIGRTNDAILYGATVTLFVRGDDDSLATIGPQVPATASAVHGKPFLEIFEEAGRDFYEIDPALFSPAEILFHNIDTGCVHRFGRTEPDILKTSFGLNR